VGLLNRADVLRFLHLHAELHLQDGQAARARPRTSGAVSGYPTHAWESPPRSLTGMAGGLITRPVARFQAGPAGSRDRMVRVARAVRGNALRRRVADRIVCDLGERPEEP
jgi:hypothetical protein